MSPFRSLLLAALLAPLFPIPVQAIPVVIDFTYARQSGSSGTASAELVVDDSLFATPGVYRTGDGSFSALQSFQLTLSGIPDPANNGVFDESDFDDIVMRFNFSIDLSSEILGQTTGGPGGNSFDFNFESSSLGIEGVDVVTFRTGGGTQQPDGSFEFERIDFRGTSVVPTVVPEPSTAGLLLLGVGALGVGRRARRSR